MINILIVFSLGVLGSYIRILLIEKYDKGLLLANSIGVLIAVNIQNLQNTQLVITGLCGSLTSFSALIKRGSNSFYYLLSTVLICFLLSKLVFVF